MGLFERVTLLFGRGQGRSTITLRLLAISICAAFTLFCGEAISRRLGGSQIIGLSPTTSGGCSCHTTSNSTATTLSATSGSGSWTVEKGSTGNSFTVTVSNASAAAAGTNIAIKTASTGSTNAGTLSVATGSGLQVVSGELTHDAPKTMSSGSAAFTFSWAAPSTHGTYYLQAIGNAVNNNGQNDAGDQWNWMTAQAIKVAGITVTSPNGGEAWCAGSTHSITWTSTAVTSAKIEISTNGGANYTSLATGISTSTDGSQSYSWVIPSTQALGTSYRIRITDESVTTRSDESDANFTIAGSPAITTQPAATQTACAGTSTSLTVAATGSGLSYQWRKGGNAINGATSATYTIPSPTPTDAGTYDVVVTGTCGSVTSNGSVLTVNSLPAITTQPASQQVCAGTAASLTVAATGTGLTYQWRKGGNAINGATSATYNIPNPVAADAGSYDVVVSGACPPSVTSSAAILTVKTAPAITSQPTSAIKCTGESVTFSVTATGSAGAGGLTYQWRKGGTAITGATAATYTIGFISTTHAGTYDVVVTGDCSPAATSSSATLTVNQGPEITTQPQSKTVCAGQPVTFSVTATGGGVTYQWRKNFQDIGGATTASYTIDNVRPEDAAAYDVVVGNGNCSGVLSTSASLVVTRLPVITVQPSSTSAVAGSKVVLTVDATGDDLQFQWRKNGQNIPGSTTSTLTLNNVQDVDAADYDVQVKNSCTTATSSTAKLTILAPGAGAVLTLSQSTVDFGNVKIGSPKDLTFATLITNSGDSVLKITGMTVTGANAGDFTFSGATAPFDLVPGSSKSVVLRFTPAAAGARSAKLELTSNAKSNPSLELKGNGVAGGVLGSIITSVAFGELAPGASDDTSIVVCNNGTVPVTILSMSIGTSTDFSLGTLTLPTSIAPGECVTLTVTFRPTSAGAKSASLVIHSDGSPADLTIPLNGTGSGTVSAPMLPETVVSSLRIAPNPATDATTVSVHLAKPARVEVSVVDGRGATVRRFSSGSPVAGTYSFVWDGRTADGSICPSGRYLVTVRSGSEVISAPVVIVR